MKEFEVTLTAVSRKTFKLRADSQEDAFLLASSMTKMPRIRGDRVGIISNAGGLGTLTTDALVQYGFTLPELDQPDREKLAACRDELFGGDMLALTEGYYRDVAAMAERKPAILGHIDLVTKLNRGNAFFDEEDPRYRAAALEALHHADPDRTVLEINTGAVARGYRDDPYPAPFLLKEWRAMGGQVILTADAHSPETVIFGYRQAAELACAAGYRESVLLTGRGWEPCPL